MTRFIDEKIEVEKTGVPPQPARFGWRKQEYVVEEVLQEWVDTGFGTLGPASRVWYNRRHRRYYIVRTSSGEIFKMYYDYAHKKSPSWWLVSQEDTSPHEAI